MPWSARQGRLASARKTRRRMCCDVRAVDGRDRATLGDHAQRDEGGRHRLRLWEGVVATVRTQEPPVAIHCPQCHCLRFVSRRQGAATRAVSAYVDRAAGVAWPSSAASRSCGGGSETLMTRRSWRWRAASGTVAAAHSRPWPSTERGFRCRSRRQGSKGDAIASSKRCVATIPRSRATCGLLV